MYLPLLNIPSSFSSVTVVRYFTEASILLQKYVKIKSKGDKASSSGTSAIKVVTEGFGECLSDEYGYTGNSKETF